VRRFGKVRVSVNNAGVVQHALLSQTTYNNWDWQPGVNLTGWSTEPERLQVGGR
jgi:NAD(P)-dependent dehydrogenase (short-subunit alcohol dehydrogenase family)